MEAKAAKYPCVVLCESDATAIAFDVYVCNNVAIRMGRTYDATVPDKATFKAKSQTSGIEKERVPLFDGASGTIHLGHEQAIDDHRSPSGTRYAL